MHMSKLKLVSIISEPVVTAKLVQAAQKVGATGYTISNARGHGTAERATGEIPDEKEKIEIIAEPAAVLELLKELHAHFLSHYSVIVYVQDIEILRSDKFSTRKAKSNDKV